MTDDIHKERVPTLGAKRRGVVKVLKAALQEAQQELVANRVVGIFGVVIREDGTASLLSALTVDELRVVMKAIPEGLHKIVGQLKGTGPEQGS